MITKFLGVTIQFNEMEDDHIIVASFDEIDSYIKEYYNDLHIRRVLIEPVNYYFKKSNK